MKMIVMLAGLLITAMSVKAQPVTITLKNNTAPDGTEVWFCRSIDKQPENYVIMYDKAVFNNGEAVKSFSIDTTMMVMILNTPYSPKIRLVVDKGSTITVGIKQDTLQHTFDLSFSGNNAKGLDVYYNNPIFVMSKFQHEIVTLLKACKTFSGTTEKLEVLKQHFFRPMDSLYSTKAISKSYYQYVDMDKDAIFTNAVGSLVDAYLFNYSMYKDTFYLQKNDFISLQKWAFTKYDPFSDRFHNSYFRTDNSMIKCRMIMGNLLPVTKTYNLGLWDSVTVAYNYAPPAIQERMFAAELWAKQRMGVIGMAEADNEYNRLSKAFRRSPFLPALASLLQKDTPDIPAFAFGKFDDSTRSFRYMTQDTSDLKGIITKYFPNKAVMVDLWATWCSPCKQEFAYAKELNAFLKKHDIVLLYVSVDYENNAQAWVKDINDYKLDGYHLLRSQKAMDDLRQLSSDRQMGIPKYLLFSNKGVLMDNNLPNPSTGEELYNTIIHKLQL